MESLEIVPKVSVCVVAYNQENYIRECLDSIIAQETKFPFEIIVGDDCSEDATTIIIKEFEDRFPGKVRVLYHPKNVGPTRNYGSVHALARGELIAHIDGDDYMLPGKLQIQADGMDANPECSFCIHEVERFDPDHGGCVSFKPKRHPKICNLVYLLLNLPFFVNSSKMYRAECREGLDLDSKERIDCYVHIHQALRGGILVLPQILGGYRLNSGIATDPTDKRKTMYKVPAPGMLEKVQDALDYARACGVAADLVNQAEGKLYFNHAYSSLMAQDFQAFSRAIHQSAAKGGHTIAQRFFVTFSFVPWFLFLVVRSRAFIKQIVAARS
jgi:glycosyltransferase involved in cell wall biosynthesis